MVDAPRLRLAEAPVLRHVQACRTARYRSQGFGNLTAVTIEGRYDRYALAPGWLASLAADAHRLVHLALLCPLARSLHERIVIPTLRSLRLGLHDPLDVIPATLLITPAVENLQINGIGVKDVLVDTFFQAVQAREKSERYPRLLSVHFEGILWTERGLDALFAMTHNILVAHLAGSENNVLSRIISTPASTWPSLQTLSVDFPSCSSEEYILLAQERAGTLRTIHTPLYRLVGVAPRRLPIFKGNKWYEELYARQMQDHEDLCALAKLVHVLPLPPCFKPFAETDPCPPLCSEHIWARAPCERMFPPPCPC
jgi:hypothetical protein